MMYSSLLVDDFASVDAGLINVKHITKRFVLYRRRHSKSESPKKNCRLEDRKEKTICFKKKMF